MAEQSRRRRLLAPGSVLGALALAVALAQPAQAAIQRLSPGSVGTRALKDGAVTTPKLRAGAVTSTAVRDGSILPVDLDASARPRLPRVYTTSAALVTPSGTGTNVVSLALPSGSWALLGKATVGAWSNGYSWCVLDDGARLDGSSVNTVNLDLTSIPMTLAARVTYAGPRTVTVSCTGMSAQLRDVKLFATEVQPG